MSAETNSSPEQEFAHIQNAAEVVDGIEDDLSQQLIDGNEELTKQYSNVAEGAEHVLRTGDISANHRDDIEAADLGLEAKAALGRLSDNELVDTANGMLHEGVKQRKINKMIGSIQELQHTNAEIIRGTDPKKNCSIRSSTLGTWPESRSR